ncbi:MAG: hypothetical protein AB7O68_24185 [Pirellulales bacterium]
MHRTILAAVFLAALCDPSRAATIQFLTPAGSSLGVAYGVDGLNVVGQDVAQRGFLYNGATKTYTVIQPGAGPSAAHGISGNLIVGTWGKLGFLYDGVSYTTLSHPLGTVDTTPWGIDGNNIVGEYIDASNITHGFLYDGTTYSTLDVPAAKHTFVRGVSGSNIVGYYTDAKNRTHGFVYDGTTWTTLDDPLFPAAGITAVYGIDGGNIVGNTLTGTVASAAFVYDGASFNHPFGIEGYLWGTSTSSSAFPATASWARIRTSRSCTSSPSRLHCS